ncbi:MAG: type I 3-dehydroquinate dehydratase [Sutterellaceae bacterium]|nr:type I 3-dehydroquinate dehydratase [Sutterellaceae bacterium]MDY2868082.1 type I 3-dehydroquinate dehydratase [Mesosutterella sp.]
MGGLARGADGALRYEVPEKGITIGEGLPGILVSASGRTPDEILGAAGALARDPDVDGIELRLDGLDMGRNSDEILTLCNLVNNAWEKAGGKLLIVTVRTKAEGGAASYSEPEYLRLLGSLVRFARMDLVDIESSHDSRVVSELVRAAHGASVGVIMSRHNFTETPSVSEMLGILRREKALGGDIEKLAVMPRKAEDVASLLLATARAKDEGLGPLITMSMGALGSVSRIAGGTFGSSLTFAMAGKASAPGQMAVKDVKDAILALGRK